MKRILLYVITTFLVLPQAYSQSLPMLGEKTAWKYGLSSFTVGAPRGTFLEENYYELMPEDSVVEGTVYRKLAVTSLGLDANSGLWDDGDCPKNANQSPIYEEIPWDEGKTIVLIREDSGRIYIQRQSYIDFMGYSNGGQGIHDTIYIDQNDGPDQVLYDFTLGEGDQYPMIGDVTVKSVEQVTTGDGVCRKLLTLSNDIQILEGMGCVDCAGMFIGYQSSNKIYHTNYGIYYEGYSDLFYPDGVDSFYISYSWTTSSVRNTVGKSKKEFSSRINDLQGRRLNGLPTKGVYIQDGKKYVK